MFEGWEKFSDFLHGRQRLSFVLEGSLLEGLVWIAMTFFLGTNQIVLNLGGGVILHALSAAFFVRLLATAAVALHGFLQIDTAD